MKVVVSLDQCMHNYYVSINYCQQKNNIEELSQVTMALPVFMHMDIKQTVKLETNVNCVFNQSCNDNYFNRFFSTLDILRNLV